MVPYYPNLVLLGLSMSVILTIILSIRVSVWILILTFLLLIHGIRQFNVFKWWKSNYSINVYKSWLVRLKEHPDIKIISFKQWLDNPVKPDNKLLMIMRHDVDINLNRTRQMIEVEREVGFPACYFFRNDAERFTFEEATDIIHDLMDDELFEVGFHYETLSRVDGDIDKVQRLFEQEIDEFREVYPELKMICAHGDRYSNRQLVKNDILDLVALDLVSAYDIDHDIYISEIGGNHHHQSGDEMKSFTDRLEVFLNPPHGKLAQILVHADWWF